MYRAEIASLLLLLFGLKATVALGLYEPADGKVIWGAWVDSSVAGTPNSLLTAGGDSPTLFDKRLGQNAGVFQLSQNLPLAISVYDGSKLTANLSLVEATKTDAILFLTVYPVSFTNYTDEDISTLAYQLSNITDPTLSSRRVLLRFAPEMNGNWFAYGMQPVQFIAEWKRIVTAVRAITNRVAFVWSPNSANEYPFAATIPTNKTEATALDTNNNGVLDNGDDPFTPYWPGSEWVDWVGISLYWKGNPSSGTPPHDNSASPSDYWTQMVQGGPDGSNASFPFYTMFAAKYDLPLVMSEGGAAFALFQAPSSATLPVGAGQTTILQTFWRSYLNATFFSTFPKAKMFMNFEFVKYDEDSVTGEDNGVTRDYRITWNSDSLAAFQSDIAALSSTLQWAVTFVAGVDPLTIGGGQTPQSGASSSSSSGSGSSTAKSGSVRKSVCGLVLVTFVGLLL